MLNAYLVRLLSHAKGYTRDSGMLSSGFIPLIVIRIEPRVILYPVELHTLSFSSKKVKG